MTHTGSTHHIWQRSAAQRCCPGGHADSCCIPDDHMVAY